MLKFVYSKDFIITSTIFIMLVVLFGIDKLANYVQVTQIFVWGFILHKMKVHHTLLKELTEDN